MSAAREGRKKEIQMSHEAILREILADMGESRTLADKVQLRLTHVFPPIPIRSFDWAAYDDNRFDGADDAGAQMVGTGATITEAITDFAEQLSEKLGAVENYFKCANCDHDQVEHPRGACTKCDCCKWALDSPHTVEP
jgi:hypothetical protein